MQPFCLEWLMVCQQPLLACQKLIHNTGSSCNLQKNFWAQNMALNGTTSRREDSPNVSFQKTKCPTPAGISFFKTPTVHNINGMTLHVSKNKMPNSCGHFTFQNTHCLQMKNSLNSLNPLLRLPPNTLQNSL